jgi:sialate O-acetylesterase
MLDDWRKSWGAGELPFYTVEIAPYTYPTDKDNAYIAAFFRENQRKLAKMLPGVGIVSTVDIGSAATVHPPDKTKVGERLALLAMTQTYGIKGSYEESAYKGYTTEGNKLSIAFSGNVSLKIVGDTLQDIEIAGEDQVFYPAQAMLQGNKLLVWSDYIVKPKSVRYCFKAYQQGNLFNEKNLPVPPFRTDNWSIIQKKTP